MEPFPKRRFTLLWPRLVVVAALSADALNAQTIFDTTQSPRNDFDHLYALQAEAFTVPPSESNSLLEAVILRLDMPDSETPTVSVKMFFNSSQNLPSNPIEELNAPAILESGLLQFTPSAPLALVPGQQYWITLEGNAWWVGGNGNTSMAGFQTSSASWVPFTPPAPDVFQMRVDVLPVPEPSAITTVVLLTACGANRRAAKPRKRTGDRV